MSECCCPEPAAATRPSCPSCSARSAPVDVSTLKALLTPTALARLRFASFFFCASAECATVYFSLDGQVFTTADVRVPVWQKELAGARLICYCFGENEEDMRREIEARGRTAAADRVKQHIADRRCACEVRNPRGACCLGDLVAAAKRLSTTKGTINADLIHASHR